jgi:hypothetical protein
MSMPIEEVLALKGNRIPEGYPLQYRSRCYEWSMILNDDGLIDNWITSPVMSYSIGAV